MNVNETIKNLSKKHLLESIRDDFNVLPENYLITMDGCKYIDYIQLRLCPRTNRLQFKDNDDYNYRLLENEYKDDLKIIASNCFKAVIEYL